MAIAWLHHASVTEG